VVGGWVGGSGGRWVGGSCGGGGLLLLLGPAVLTVDIIPYSIIS